jgi:Putative transposase/Transposase zinc-binding domain
VESCPRIYRPRRPQQTPLYRLLESLFEPVKLCWEERFEARYGFWQGCWDQAVARYLDCGVWDMGFARVRCGECRYEMLVAFSCKQRELCPSCAAKRGSGLAAFLVDHVLEDVAHAQWVFTIPKMLRPVFFRRRELRGTLARLAWQTVQKLMAAAASEPELRPGMVSVIQTFGDRINPHPHVHALVSRGGWTRDDRFVPIPYVDPTAAEKLFRHQVFAFLLREELISPERIELLSSWRHSGFSVHNSVYTPSGDQQAVEALVRYMMRPPVSLARLRLLPGRDEVLHFPKTGGDDPGPPQPERIDAMDFVARVLAQIPPPRKHLVRYHGYYSNAARGKRKRDHDSRLARAGVDLEQEVAASPAAAALRKRWADLLRRVYEVDPLVCPRCSATMRVVGFITRRETIDRILDHLRRPPTSRPRSPPAPAASIPAPPS